MTWSTEYLSALRVRDINEQTGRDIYEKCVKLADRAVSQERLASNHPLKSARKDQDLHRPVSTDDSSLSGPSFNEIKQDLVEAQRARSDLEANMGEMKREVERLRTASRMDGKALGELAAEKSSLLTRLRDRDEELKGKAKLLENLHDETVALTLQLNMIEQQNENLRAENKELVDRWMARMGQEADAVNVASKFS